jgi:hypothetical protein
MRYKFDLYKIDNDLVFSHQVELTNFYPKAIKIAEDMLLTLGYDYCGLYVIYNISANSRVNIKLTILS